MARYIPPFCRDPIEMDNYRASFLLLKADKETGLNSHACAGQGDPRIPAKEKPVESSNVTGERKI
jgi:hypothetical protein